MNFIKIPLQILSTSLRNFYQHDCIILSSSVSFAFLLSLIPFSALTVFLIGIVQKFFDPQNVMFNNTHQFLTYQILLLIPFISEEWVTTNIIYANNGATSFTIINLLLLPVVSSLVFKTLETSYHRIFQVKSRFFVLRHIFYAILSVFLPLLIFVSSFTWNILYDPVMAMLSSINQTEYLLDVKQYAGSNTYCSMVVMVMSKINLITITGILIFYLATIRLFLQIRIKLWQRIFTGLMFCMLWILARKLFSVYIHYISEINLVYGSLSSIIIILLWIFYSSITLLYSLELLCAMHGWKKTAPAARK
jgi:membrane protein